MGYTIKYPFTFLHGKHIVVILCDQYEYNYISYDMFGRLSTHPKVGSFRHHENRHFVIQFGHGGDYVDSTECCLYEPIIKDHQVILERKWLHERKATVNKATNIR